jgi:endonuclease YncB( thermonuclease family)
MASPFAVPQSVPRVALLFGLLAALLTGCLEIETEVIVATGKAPSVQGDTATVTRIIDGDTIEVRLNDQTYPVRYIGINTPERDEPCYDDATTANASLVRGQTVTLVRDVSDTDDYDRLLRYVYVGEVFVNAELVAQGYAEAGYYPPDTAYTDTFNRLEATAEAQGLGCHPTGVFR